MTRCRPLKPEIAANEPTFFLLDLHSKVADLEQLQLSIGPFCDR